MTATVRFKDPKAAGNGGLLRTGSGQGYGLRRCGLAKLALHARRLPAILERPRAGSLLTLLAFLGPGSLQSQAQDV